MDLIDLTEITPRDHRRVGGKAAGLARLLSHALPVPPGFVVPTRVFRRFLRDNGLWEAATRGDPAGLPRAIETGRLDPAFAGALRTAAAKLGARLAVRSSGTEEDGARSSQAGRHDTMLGVAPGDETERALLSCWASLYSPRALALADGRPAPGGMAVVVQAMAPARCAGVLFTINPQNGSWREMTVECAAGLGEAVVSGHVVPDFYRVRRPRRSPRPVQRVLARIRLQTLEAPERPLLQQADLHRLCRLGLRIEALLGGPRDVEWAMAPDGALAVLQARPVTTARDVRRSGPVVWTRRFGGERWTEPATPLGWTEMQGLLDWFIAYPETSRRYLGGERPTRLVRFAPYFNVTVFRHLAFKAPGASPPRFMVELLPPDEERGWLRRHAQAPDLRVYRSILAETFAEQRWRRFRWNPFTNWRAWDEFARGLDRELAALPPLDTSADLRLRIQRCRELARAYIGIHICSLLFANIWYESALAMLGGRPPELVADLLRAPADTATGRANHALWELGRGRLSMETFLERFGHRAENSWELFSPRWREDPERVLRLAQTVAAGDEPPCGTAPAQLPRDLPRPHRETVRLAQRYLQLREDQRFHFDRILWEWKQAYLALEERHGVALRFLELIEVRALLAGELAIEEARARVDRRSEAWREECRRRREGDRPPAFVVGDQAWSDDHSAAQRLQGMGISAGVVTGPARVLRSLDEAELLRPGDILVVEATDPAWTPLFLTAAGLVMELGGMLSHGAVVAREYRLPAVVNVDGATQRLRDGDVITVDGSRGMVWIR